MSTAGRLACSIYLPLLESIIEVNIEGEHGVLAVKLTGGGAYLVFDCNSCNFDNTVVKSA